MAFSLQIYMRSKSKSVLLLSTHTSEHLLFTSSLHDFSHHLSPPPVAVLVFRDEEDGVLVAKETVMEKRKVQEAVSEWQAEKRRRVEDGEEEVGGDADDEDVQDVQVCYDMLPIASFLLLMTRHDGCVLCFRFKQIRSCL